MLLRVIVGMAMLPVLPLVIFFAPKWVLPITISLLSALAVFELLGNTRFTKNKRVLVYALVTAAAVPPCYYFDLPGGTSITGLFLFVFVLFVEALINPAETTFENICTVTMAGLAIPIFYSALVRIMMLPEGRHVIMLPFIAALLTDTCAYFTGVLFGKRKLAPEISPKKTIEGALGGLIGCILGMIGYGLIEHYAFGNGVNLWYLGVYGLFGGVVGQVGDLSMSFIKREFGMKDFGNLLPGHGGILDRFDSLLFAAPMIEILILIMPAITLAA